jgi:hypothetical protein
MTAPEADLFDVVRRLGEDEVRVLVAIARRLAMGRGQYGALDVQGDRRDWRAEAAEELLDGCVYLACETMRQRGGA